MIRIKPPHFLIGGGLIPFPLLNRRPALPSVAPSAAAALRLLVFTGCRLREILHRHWKARPFDAAKLWLLWLDDEEADDIVQTLRDEAQRNYDKYLWIMNSENDPSRTGAARELARIGLPLNMYTGWYWKTDLPNLMRFVELRADSHAQFEIRVYAEQILKIMKRWVPITFDAFLEYKVNAVSLSATAVAALARMLHGESADDAMSALSSRERDDIARIFRIPTGR